MLRHMGSNSQVDGADGARSPHVSTGQQGADPQPMVLSVVPCAQLGAQLSVVSKQLPPAIPLSAFCFGSCALIFQLEDHKDSHPNSAAKVIS